MALEIGRPRLVIDTRPMWRVVLSRTRHWLIMAVTLIVFLWLYLHEPFGGLDTNAQQTLAVFAVCVILWVTQAIPLSVTGLLAIVLLPLLTEIPTHETRHFEDRLWVTGSFALFGSEAVFFILGAFILAAAVMHSGLSTRVAMLILDRVGTTPRRLVIGVLLLSAALAHVMPEHAVAAMLLPIGLEIARALKLRPGRSAMGAALFLAMAWGAIIGGIATFLGGARNPLAIAILHSATNQSIGFAEWWFAALPLVGLSLAAAAGVLLVFFPPEIQSTAPARALLRERLQLMGRPTLEEWTVGIVLVLTIAAWVSAEWLNVSLAIIALAGAVALFGLRVISWGAVEGHVNWGVILMYGGAIALGQAMSDSGAASWVVSGVFSEELLAKPLLALLVIALVAMVLTEGISNAAVVALMLPLLLPLTLPGPDGAAPLLAVDPRLVVYAVALPAGLAFTLPISTPPNALAHSTAHVTMRQLGWRGPLMNIICLMAFALVATVWWGPVLGLR